MLTEEPVSTPTPLETVPEYSIITTSTTHPVSPTSTDTTTAFSSPDPVSKPRRKHGTLITSYILSSRQQIPATINDNDDEDDTNCPSTPPGQRKGILDTLRPRSKSDATSYKNRRPSFLKKLSRSKPVSCDIFEIIA